MHSSASVLIDFAIGLNSFLGAIYLLGSTKQGRILSIIFLIMAYVPFQFKLVYTKQLFYFPHFFLTYIPPILAFGPLFYYLVYHTVFNQPLTRRFLLKHTLFPIITTLALGRLFMMSADDKLALINRLYYDATSIEYYFLSFLCVGSILFYAWKLFQDLPTIQYVKTKNRLFIVLFSLSLMGVLFSIIGFASVLTHSLLLLFWGNLFFSVIIVLGYALHIRYDYFLSQLIREITESKYRQTHLTHININRSLVNLNYVMNQDKAYIDPQLTLKQLAKKVHLTPHQLSELLNHEVGKNFNTYVTEFRVKDAIHRLKDEPHKTILGIALSVGFNSNSAFYTAFKKITGKSPSAYRS